MGFADAVRSCLSNYANFSGRARRSEYWWFLVFCAIVSGVAMIIDNVAGLTLQGSTAGWVSVIATIALFLPQLSVMVRRMHDTDRSGWWVLLNGLCFIGSVIFFVFTLQDSKDANRYGPNPKGA